MLHQPTPRSDLVSWAADAVGVLGMIGAKLVLLGPPFDGLAGLLDQRGISYLMLADLDAPAIRPLTTPVPVGEDDTALLQLTSGPVPHPRRSGSLTATSTPT
jgi:fatty-acyl-CoA synthase